MQVTGLCRGGVFRDTGSCPQEGHRRKITAPASAPSLHEAPWSSTGQFVANDHGTTPGACRRGVQRRLPAEYLRLTLKPPQHRICAQMLQFWRRLTNQITHHTVGRVVPDHSPFREQSYPALNRYDGARRTDLGTQASLSACHAAATGPNSSRWSPNTGESLITRSLSAIAHAGSAKPSLGRARPPTMASPPTARSGRPALAAGPGPRATRRRCRRP
jgi:hypothetical protein